MLAVHEAGMNICQAYAAITLCGEGTGRLARLSIPPGAGRPSSGPHSGVWLCSVTSKAISAGSVSSVSQDSTTAALTEQSEVSASALSHLCIGLNRAKWFKLAVPKLPRGWWAGRMWQVIASG